MKENHIKYDLHDVFKVVMVDPGDPYKITKTIDLYTDYGLIEVSDVAASNRFYSTMLHDLHGSISENLKVTLEYLLNNTNDNIFHTRQKNLVALSSSNFHTSYRGHL
jgi:hypothetical protein